MVLVYKWGGIAFDDKSLIKTLVLPSDAYIAVPITFHDADGDYQVPVGKVFIAGKVMVQMSAIALLGSIGESDEVDGAITRKVISGLHVKSSGAMLTHDVIGIYTAGKYVTGLTDDTDQMKDGSAIYGVEIDA